MSGRQSSDVDEGREEYHGVYSRGICKNLQKERGNPALFRCFLFKIEKRGKIHQTY